MQVNHDTPHERVTPTIRSHRGVSLRHNPHISPTILVQNDTSESLKPDGVANLPSRFAC